MRRRAALSLLAALPAVLAARPAAAQSAAQILFSELERRLIMDYYARQARAPDKVAGGAAAAEAAGCRPASSAGSSAAAPCRPGSRARRCRLASRDSCRRRPRATSDRSSAATSCSSLLQPDS